MPRCCGVESERREHPNGGYDYYCPVCKSEYLPAVGLEFLSKPKITVSETRRRR